MEAPIERPAEHTARYKELRLAIHDLGQRGLHHSVKWAAEHLVGLPAEAAWNAAAEQELAISNRLHGESHPGYLLARSYFDLKEYRRAAHVLHGVATAASVFLRCYSLYLAGEKRKEEERIEKAGPLGNADAVNQELDQVEGELLAAEAQGLGDAFTLYLRALIQMDRDHKAEARDLLVASVTQYPCHWGAWQALQTLCEDAESISALALPAHWMRDFFIAATCLELQHNAEALSRLQSLNQMFPSSMAVSAQAAAAHYNMRNFDEAQSLFEDILARDPFRIEGMDIYSNILYVKEAMAALSHLAHSVAANNKYRPEACCVVGNYYSLKGLHERAVEYFRRALRLNRHYLSAWTLMGHEFVEMKKASAAIDAYRHAVDLNPRDYRAWYGLGQTYELLLMPYYALYYYRRATLLRPGDARMWCALGQCYENEQLGLLDAAVRCYRRAVDNNDREGIALHKLARIYSARGETDTAAHYYRLNLERLDAEGASGQDAVEALLFLADYQKDQGNLAEAELLCQRLMDYGGPANTKAKALLREIRNLQGAAAGTSAGAGAGAGAFPGTGQQLGGMQFGTPVATGGLGRNFPTPMSMGVAMADDGDGSDDTAEEIVAAGIDPHLVDIVVQQTGISRADAARALGRHNGDVVGAIMGIEAGMTSP